MGAERSIYGTMAMVVGVILAGAAWWCCGAGFVEERAPLKRGAEDMGARGSEPVEMGAGEQGMGG